MLAPPNSDPVYGSEADSENLIDTREVDIRLPMLVYVSREKRPGYDHNKKAGAMNALVRTSAIMSNCPFILNLDCDHYIHNSLALRDGSASCLTEVVIEFAMSSSLKDLKASIQVIVMPIITLFFDVSMRAYDGLQGPMYVGTGCIFRRIALYGFSPPRATEHHGWFGSRKFKMLLRRKVKKENNSDEIILLLVQENEEDDDLDIESLLLPKRFGTSTSLAASVTPQNPSTFIFTKL